IDDSVVHHVTLAQLISGDNINILIQIIEIVIVIAGNTGVQHSQLDVAIAVDILDSSAGIDSLHDHVGHTVAVVVDDLQPVAVLIAIDSLGILTGGDILIQELTVGNLIGDIIHGLGADIDLTHNVADLINAVSIIENGFD